MKLKTRSKYAINAMIELALHENEGPIPLAKLCQMQNVSVSYLEQLFCKLRKCGLVDATRGPGGGFTLGQKGAQVSIADIVTAIDGNAPLDEPSVQAANGPTKPDMTQGIWDGLNSTAISYLQSISLSSLASQRQPQVSVVPRPQSRTRTKA